MIYVMKVMQKSCTFRSKEDLLSSCDLLLTLPGWLPILPLPRKKKNEKAARPQGALGPGSEALNRDEAEEILKESLEAMLPNRMV